MIQQEARLKGREAGLTWCLRRDKTLAIWYFSDIKFQKAGDGEVEDHVRCVQRCWSCVHCGPVTRFTVGDWHSFGAACTVSDRSYMETAQDLK